jgi:hypothetical protein
MDSVVFAGGVLAVVCGWLIGGLKALAVLLRGELEIFLEDGSSCKESLKFGLPLMLCPISSDTSPTL